MSDDLRFSDRLSSRVLTFIASEDSPDESDLSAEERADSEKWKRLAAVIVDRVISSRETLAAWGLPQIEQLVQTIPDTIAFFLDARFTKDMVRDVPGCVDRLMELSRLEAQDLPSEVTNGYLREAVRTYILGLPQASVALSRAAMEQALKEGMGYQGKRTFVGMKDLLDEAESANVIRDKMIKQMARDVAREADDVLHEKPTTISKAYETLVKLRGVLQHVYGSG